MVLKLFLVQFVLFSYRVLFVQVYIMTPDIYFNPKFSFHYYKLSVV